MRQGPKILLSASVPSAERNEIYHKIPNAQIQIEEAVVGLARNLFQADGQLIFGGHPSISPLVAMVATEYEINQESENLGRNDAANKLLVIYQSRAYEEIMPNETSTLFNLGYAKIVWTDAAEGEKINAEIKNAPQCRQSLEKMRQEMINQPLDALVCMGGMEGVEVEFRMFTETHPQKPVYLLETTGGATANIALEQSNNPMVHVIDRIEYPPEIAEKPPENVEFKIIPYTFITSRIVEELEERLDRQQGQRET